jgi:hypothetical protein
MATPQWQAALNKEGRLDLALQAYQKVNFEHLPLRQDVQRTVKDVTTLYQQYSTTTQFYLKESPFTSIKEESLVQWILSMNRHGMPPCIATVWEMAHLLVTQHEQPTTVDQIWVHNFINCHDMLKSKYNWKYNY